MRTLVGLGAVAVLSMTVVAAAARPKRATRTAQPARPASTTLLPPVSLAEAKMTAEMLDDATQLLIHSIHDWYPNKTGQPVAAATMVREVQDKLNRRAWPGARFIGVNAVLMNPDHRPRDPFERNAQDALRRGSAEFSAIEKGEYRVAKVVRLGGGCFSCHWSDDTSGSRAALTFRFPLLSSKASANQP